MKTMKRLLAGALCLGMLMTGSLLAQAPPVPAGKGTLTTLSGKTYLGASVSRIQPDGLVIAHEGGMAKVPFLDLDPVLRERFGYDPEKAAQFAEEQKRDLAALDAEKARMAAEQAKAREAAAVEAGKPQPKLMTVEQIKRFWLTSLPAPRSLDRDYHDKQKEYVAITEAINAGRMDLDAEKQAAQWNLTEYRTVGDSDQVTATEGRIRDLDKQIRELKLVRLRQGEYQSYKQISDRLTLLGADLAGLRRAVK